MVLLVIQYPLTSIHRIATPISWSDAPEDFYYVVMLVRNRLIWD